MLIEYTMLPTVHFDVSAPDLTIHCGMSYTNIFPIFFSWGKRSRWNSLIERNVTFHLGKKNNDDQHHRHRSRRRRRQELPVFSCMWCPIPKKLDIYYDIKCWPAQSCYHITLLLRTEREVEWLKLKMLVFVLWDEVKGVQNGCFLPHHMARN